MSKETSEPKCPQCGGLLQEVKDTGYLNKEQFESVRAGDFFCVTCKSDKARSGYKYFWKHEI